jgi:8-oxo-dGTP pyrophosphatase MutT (NUDIX family)
METEKQKSAGAIIYYLNEKHLPVYLFLQNTLKKTYWEFPKGKIEGNEEIEKTVKREVLEETNLSNIKIISGFKHVLRWFYRFEGKTISKEAVYLIAKISEEDKDNVKISEEHQKFEFMDFNVAMQKLNIKANKEMLQEANKFILKLEKQRELF